MRVGLVACCKQKLDYAAPAKDLYQSPLFKHAVRWITSNKRVDVWGGILSAKYGLVLPDQVIEPYDMRVSAMKVPAREAWEKNTRQQIIDHWGRDTIYLVLMGSDYRAALDGLLIEDPVACWTQWRLDRGMTRRRAAMSIGLILQALKENRPYY
jgi:hypothetical protein